MKRYFFIFLVFFLLMAGLPLISAKDSSAFSASVPEENSVQEKQNDKNFFKILDTSSQKIIEIEDMEFCIGTVAYEMPASFEPETLKAQCVAAYTYFSRLRNIQRETPDPKLKGADFAADLSKGEFYNSPAQRKEKWGELEKEYTEKIHSAVSTVFGKVLSDSDGNLIDALYHALSSGTTENSEDIFGGYEPYLRAVASPFDKYAPFYCTEYKISLKDFQEKLGSLEIGSIERTNSGTVKTIKIGSQNYTGQKIRELFELRSANFEIENHSNEMIFKVYGYGHGVGMSQYGANCMAQQGADFQEILHYYYQNINITKV